MKNKIQLFFLFIAISSLSCKDSNVNTEDQPVGNIIFETEYLNFAWGYARNGSYVAEDGKVYTFDIGKANIQWKENSDGYYTEEELFSKYRHFDTLRRVISTDTIQWWYTLAHLVNTNSYSDTLSMGADMGTVSFSLYFYNSEKKKYRKIVLCQEGDWQFYNTSASAVELMKLIRRK